MDELNDLLFYGVDCCNNSIWLWELRDEPTSHGRFPDTFPRAIGMALGTFTPR